MSIKIDRKKCTGCGKCRNVCPGNLIYRDEDQKSFIRYPKDCWGCTACVKECDAGAIMYYLGADIGGRGTTLHTRQAGTLLHWVFRKPEGKEESITIDRKQSNKY